MIGKTYDVKKLESSEVLVEVKAQQLSTILLKEARWAYQQIRVTPRRNLNSSEGVISEADLIYVTDADLLEGFTDQGVTAIKRIFIHRDDKLIATQHITPNFDRSTLREYLFAGYIHCYVAQTSRTDGDGSSDNGSGMPQTLAVAYLPTLNVARMTILQKTANPKSTTALTASDPMQRTREIVKSLSCKSS